MASCASATSPGSPSAPTRVSHHARALRTAGLVASRRDGKMVLYALTDTGTALLEAVLPHVGAGPS